MKSNLQISIHSNVHELTDEIFRITSIIQTNYPSFYSTLVETPIHFKNGYVKPKNKELVDYLEFLKTQLSFFEGQK